MTTRCDRCNGSPVRPATHPRQRPLCAPCARIIGVTLEDDVRAGVDCYLAADPRGPVINAIVGILQEAVR